MSNEIEIIAPCQHHKTQHLETLHHNPRHRYATSPTSRQMNKRVTFEPIVMVYPIDCRLSAEEQSRSFYSKNELDVLSLEAKAISAFSTRQLRLLMGQSLLGLEMRTCPNQVRTKVFARRVLLHYQQNLVSNASKTSEEKLMSLAAASAKLSRGSKLLAIERARQDFVH